MFLTTCIFDRYRLFFCTKYKTGNTESTNFDLEFFWGGGDGGDQCTLFCILISTVDKCLSTHRPTNDSAHARACACVYIKCVDVICRLANVLLLDMCLLVMLSQYVLIVTFCVQLSRLGTEMTRDSFHGVKWSRSNTHCCQ